VTLRRHEAFEVLEFDVNHSPDLLPKLAAEADLVFHLAGVNRPRDPAEFTAGNTDLTRALLQALEATGRRTPVVLSSSIQAALDNPYGQSKKGAEDALLEYHQRTGAAVYLYRFPNVFGKWSRPNYNTVVATFCHNISRGLPVQLSNRDTVIHFVYVDTVVAEFLAIALRQRHDASTTQYEVAETHHITLGELHDLLLSFRENRRTGLLPDLSQPLTRHLYSTYLSFLDEQDFAHPVNLKTDDRGWLFELVKSPHAGQVFVSRTKPGVTRGNHYHHSKVEKFCVIQGEGVIRFRQVLREDVLEYRVNDRDIRVVDIPPGYTHSIENTGSADMLTLFWANEILDPQRPDVYFEKVLR
jgi:UDP-2-acetamido-2,6-beta-L-arabino-hexul-4-ose reductase